MKYTDGGSGHEDKESNRGEVERNAGQKEESSKEITLVNLICPT